MKKISIYKAQSIGDDITESVEIILTTELPEMKDYKKSPAVFNREATELEEILIHALPGGTYDSLLRKMLERKQSHFVVPFKD